MNANSKPRPLYFSISVLPPAMPVWRSANSLVVAIAPAAFRISAFTPGPVSDVWSLATTLPPLCKFPANPDFLTCTAPHKSPACEKRN